MQIGFFISHRLSIVRAVLVKAGSNCGSNRGLSSSKKPPFVHPSDRVSQTSKRNVNRVVSKHTLFSIISLIKMYVPLLNFLLFSVILRLGATNFLKSARERHQNQVASTEDFRYLAASSDPNYINKVLDNILVPRVVGTPNHEKVFKYIKKELRLLNWHVDVDEFMDKVPIFGNLKFKNIVATHNPQAERYLVLACHYDSKYFKDIEFVGAIDSAVPCAMMLEIAKTLSQDLQKSKNKNVALKLVFFDGEEAFENWGPHDSIYGAKHLARTLHSNRSLINGENVSELDKIDMLALLDLIGFRNPQFLNFFENTKRWFLRLIEIENTLHEMNLLKNHYSNYFLARSSYGRIEDDHLPFLKRNVPILHVISTPFPPEWHTAKDNRDIVDMDTVVNINLILKGFISEYLHFSLAGSSVFQELPHNEL
ncbi:glutaminyl-peptide cyclotransferase-like isoform X3 [Zophobas morio]